MRSIQQLEEIFRTRTSDEYIDTEGRPYALVSEVKEGDVLIADGGFIWTRDVNCLDKGSENIVCEDLKNKELYVHCRCGRHYLDGQHEERDGLPHFYIGFYKKDQKQLTTKTT